VAVFVDNHNSHTLSATSLRLQCIISKPTTSGPCGFYLGHVKNSKRSV